MSEERNTPTPEAPAEKAENTQVLIQSRGDMGYRGLLMAGGLLVVAVAVLFTLMQWFYGDNNPVGANVPSVPSSAASATLDPGTQNYKELLLQKNTQAVKEAVKKGYSVVPPPIGQQVEVVEPPPQPEVPAPPVKPILTASPPPVSPPPAPTPAKRTINANLVKFINDAMTLAPHQNVVVFATTPEQVVAENKPDKKDAPSAPQTQPETENPHWLLRPGEVVYGAFDTAINSDYSTPILRVTLAGPKLGGWRLLGGYQLVDDKMVIRFNTLVAPNGTPYTVEAYAIDPQTALPAMADGVDYHWVRRYVLRFAGLFLQGVGQAASQPNTQVSALAGGTATTTLSGLGPMDQIKMGLGEVGKAIGEDMQQFAQRPPTVWINPGTPLAVMFAKPVVQLQQNRP